MDTHTYVSIYIQKYLYIQTYLCINIFMYKHVISGNMGGYRGSKLNAIGREEGDTSPKKGILPLLTSWSALFVCSDHRFCNTSCRNLMK
jgi:hypothetical protein